MFIDGNRRTAFIKSTSISVTGSTGLGIYDTAQYSRLAGFVTVTGSVTLRFRSGVNSAAFQISSSFAINSGPFIIDQINFGHVLDLSFTAANSQIASVLIYGESLR